MNITELHHILLPGTLNLPGQEYGTVSIGLGSHPDYTGTKKMAQTIYDSCSDYYLP